MITIREVQLPFQATTACFFVTQSDTNVQYLARTMSTSPDSLPHRSEIFLTRSVWSAAPPSSSLPR